jgi:hypothetical protein
MKLACTEGTYGGGCALKFRELSVVAVKSVAPSISCFVTAVRGLVDTLEIDYLAWLKLYTMLGMAFPASFEQRKASQIIH